MMFIKACLQIYIQILYGQIILFDLSDIIETYIKDYTILLFIFYNDYNQTIILNEITENSQTNNFNFYT
jgi:hypothetical protein